MYMYLDLQIFCLLCTRTLPNAKALQAYVLKREGTRRSFFVETAISKQADVKGNISESEFRTHFTPNVLLDRSHDFTL